MNLISQDLFVSVPLFVSAYYKQSTALFRESVDITTRGNVPGSSRCYLFRTEHAAPIPKLVEMWYRSLGAPLHLTTRWIKVRPNVPGNLFAPLRHYHPREHMSVNNQAISSWSFAFFQVASVAQKNVRDIITKRVKDGRGRRFESDKGKNKRRSRTNKAHVALCVFAAPVLSTEPDI